MKSLQSGEKYEIHDWESLISDPDNFSQFSYALKEVIVNPVAFQKNLAWITNDYGYLMKFDPYSYQEEYALDPVRRKILVKSRQVGFTVEEAYIKYWKMHRRKKYEANFVHLREENVKKYIDVIREVNHNIIAPLRLNFERDRDLFLMTDKGSKVRGLSSKAVESGRGFTGDIVLDEFAIVEKPERLLAGAASMAVRGDLELTIGSTPYGKHNEFHRLIEETGWDTKKRCWGSIGEYKEIEKEGRKLLKEGYFEATTLREARDLMYKWIDKKTIPVMKKDTQEFLKAYRRVQRNNTSDFSFHCAPWYLCPDLKWSSIMSLNLSHDKLLQEYFLAFLDEATAMLTMAEIDACVNPDLQLIPPSHIKPFTNRNIYLGCDPSLGKKNETAWFFTAEPLFKAGIMLRPWQVLWYESTFDKRKVVQEGKVIGGYVPRLIQQIKQYNPIKCYFDETGVGAAVVEDIIAGGIPESRIEGINMSSRVKYEPLIYNLVSIIRGELIEIPDNDRIKDQLFALEEDYTSSGQKRFTGKIRSSDGQDDLAWGLALAVAIGSEIKSTGYKMDDVDTGDIEEEKYEEDYNRREKNERYF